MAVKFIDVTYSIKIFVFTSRPKPFGKLKTSHFPLFNFQCLILQLNSNKPHSSVPDLLDTNFTVLFT